MNIDVRYFQIKGFIEDRIKAIADAHFSKYDLTIQNLYHRHTYKSFCVAGMKENFEQLELPESMELITIGSSAWRLEFEMRKHIYAKVKGADIEAARKILSHICMASIEQGEVYKLATQGSYNDAVDYISKQLGVKHNIFFHNGKPYEIQFAPDADDFQ